jgi:hypothetical protein
MGAPPGASSIPWKFRGLERNSSKFGLVVREDLRAFTKPMSFPSFYFAFGLFIADRAGAIG